MPGKDVMPQLPDIADDLSDIMSDLQGIGGGLSDAQIVQQTVPSEVWKGASAHAYTQELDTLKNKVSTLSGKAYACAQDLQPFREKLSEIRHKITTWQNDYDEAENNYVSAVMTDAAFAKVENWTQAQCDAAEAKHRRERDEKQTGLMLNYRAALSELDTIGKGIANKIAYYMNELVPADSRGSREAVGKAYLADMPLAGGKARLDYERKRAKEAKNDLKGVIDNKPPNFKEFNAKWGNELANNSYFALSFMVELKGAGLDRNMRKLLGNGWREGAIDQDQFMENIGSAYIIASGSRRDSDFDEATAATAAKWRSTSWFPELIEMGRKRTGIKHDGATVAYIYGYYPQSQLLAAGNEKLGITPNADYFATVGSDISRLDWKNAHDSKVRQFSRGSWDIIEVAPSGYLDMYHKYSNAKLGHYDDSLQVYVDIAAKDRKNPSALQALLLSNIHSNKIEFPYNKDGSINHNYNRYWNMNPSEMNNYINQKGYESNVNYLVKERGAIFQSDNSFRASKMHEALGKAVQSQSARHTDAAAMAMTSEYLNSYVDLTGGNRSSGYQLYDTMNKVIQTKEIGNDLKTSRVYISNIMSNNINDVSATFESNTNTDSLQKGIAVKDGHISLRFNFNSSKKGFSSLIDELAKDRPGNLDIGVARSDNGKFVIHDQNKLNDFKTKPTALQRIILASINESGSQVEKNIGGKNTTSMEKIVEGHSNLLKYVTGVDSTVKGEIAKHKDDINSFMASAAEAGLGLLPLPGGPIVSRIGSFGLSQAGGQLMETIFPTDNQAKTLKDSSNTNDYVEKLFNQSVTRSIIKRADYHDISTPSEYGIWYAKNYGTNVNDIKFWYTDSSGSMKLMDPEDIKKCNPNSVGKNGEPRGLRAKYSAVYEKIHDNFK